MTAGIIATFVMACSSTPAPGPPATNYLGSLGAAGCKPAAALKGWQTSSGLPETGVDSSQGSFWAAFFQSVPPPSGTDIKVVWRMTGSGPFIFRVTDADGKTVALDWGPEIHTGSSWHHPGDEVGTGFTFPHAGCWNVHVTRSYVAGDLWLEVAG